MLFTLSSNLMNPPWRSQGQTDLGLTCSSPFPHTCLYIYFGGKHYFGPDATVIGIVGDSKELRRICSSASRIQECMRFVPFPTLLGKWSASIK